MKTLSIVLVTGLGVAVVGGLAFLALRKPTAVAYPTPVAATAAPIAAATHTVPNSSSSSVASTLATAASVATSVNALAGGISGLFDDLGW